MKERRGERAGGLREREDVREPGALRERSSESAGGQLLYEKKKWERGGIAV